MKSTPGQFFSEQSLVSRIPKIYSAVRERHLLEEKSTQQNGLNTLCVTKPNDTLIPYAMPQNHHMLVATVSCPSKPATWE